MLLDDVIFFQNDVLSVCPSQYICNLETNQNIYIYTRFWESGVRGKLMPGHHQDAEYSPNPIYIYTKPHS